MPRSCFASEIALIFVFSQQVFHDTGSFEFKDENEAGHGGKPIDPALYTDVIAAGQSTGLRPAIEAFVAAGNGSWRVVYDTKLSNGLVILEHF